MKHKFLLIILLIIFYNSNGNSIPYLYNRSAVIDYINLYWDNYNEDYYNFAPLGGDCANFVTQCLVVGGRDPYDPHYYPVWTSIDYSPTFYHTLKYLIPFLETIAFRQIGDTTNLQVGDLIFWKDGERFKHTAIIVEISDSIYYSGHTTNRLRKGVEYPLSQNRHYFRILDGHIFYPNWNSQGVGYYFFNVAFWAGPHSYLDLSAAGINPQNMQEYRGFNQFTVSGIPSNASITHAYLRLTVNNCYGSGNLGLNINHITNTGTPTPYECAAPPYYLQEEEVTGSSGATLWFDLSNTSAPTHIMEANNGNYMFGIGLSENDAKLLKLYYFIGNFASMDERAKIKVFYENVNENVPRNLHNETELNQILTLPFISIRSNLIKEGTEIEFSGGNEENAMLRIYDIGGRLIRTWISSRANNINRVYWDCRDNFGNQCTKGIYFVRLSTIEGTLTEKLEILE